MTNEQIIMGRVNALLPPEWKAALDEKPECMTLRGVIADWLQEQGKDLEAEALRWSVEKGININGDRSISNSGEMWFYFHEGWGSGEELRHRIGNFYLCTNASLKTRSPSTVFGFLILAWVDSTDVQRLSYWNWSPKLEVVK